MKNKVFVTGIYGSGKTYFATRFAESNPGYEYVSYDVLYDYSTLDNSKVRKHLHEERDFIMDALPTWQKVKQVSPHHQLGDHELPRNFNPKTHPAEATAHWAYPGYAAVSIESMEDFCNENKVTVILIKCSSKNAWKQRLSNRCWDVSDLYEHAGWGKHSKAYDKFYTNFATLYPCLSKLCEVKFYDSYEEKFHESLEKISNHRSLLTKQVETEVDLKLEDNL